MSADAEPRRAPMPPEWRELEAAVASLLDEHRALRGRLEDTRRRVGDLEEALQAVTEGDLDPSLMAGELDVLRRRNQELQVRMDDARASVRRVLGRLRFVEEDRA